MARCIIGPKGELITVILLNGHSIKLTPDDLLQP